MPEIVKPVPDQNQADYPLTEVLSALIDRTATPTFVGPTAPAVTPMPDRYAWFQTGLGADGTGFTLWIEDGT